MCLLPSLQQSLWIAHLLEDTGFALSQGSSHTIFSPLRSTALPCWCCHICPASVFGCPQSTPCPLYIDVILLATVVSQPGHHLQQPFTHTWYSILGLQWQWCLLTAHQSLDRWLLSWFHLFGRCGYSQSRRKLNQQHIWLMNSTWPPSLSEDLLEGLGQPHPCRSYLTRVALSGSVPRHGSGTCPAAHRQTTLSCLLHYWHKRPAENSQFAASRPQPLLAVELMLLNSSAIKLSQVKMIDFSFPLSSCKQWHNGTKWLFWNKQCIF